ncbi:hypothetical protein [Brevibacterium luteolum]|uniref:hypothetical protein n=1 Tax=Brevibacterium luteolum TaxID=199591 RepID=UPI003B671FAB
MIVLFQGLIGSVLCLLSPAARVRLTGSLGIASRPGLGDVFNNRNRFVISQGPESDCTLIIGCTARGNPGVQLQCPPAASGMLMRTGAVIELSTAGLGAAGRSDERNLHASAL